MRKYFLIAFFAISISNVASQVGINTTTPSPASVLDVESSSDGVNFGGFLPPRVDATDRANIASKATAADDGLLIFFEDTRCLQMWDGVTSSWQDVYCMPVNAAPIASNVSFTGTLQQDETLTASFSYTDAENDVAGNHIYTWYRADDAGGTNQTQIQTGTANTYTLVNADVSSYIAVSVIPVAVTGTSPGTAVFSSYNGAVVSNSAPVLIGIQDFETSPASPTLALIENTAGTYQTGIGSFPNSNKFISPSRGYGVTDASADIDFGPVDASAYTSVTAHINIASFAGTSGNGADGTDYIDVYVSTDGGATYSYEVEITGFNNAKWDFDATGDRTFVYDGDNVATTYSPPSGGNLLNGPSFITITGLPNSANLLVGLVINNNSPDETWVIDDIALYGIN